MTKRLDASDIANAGSFLERELLQRLPRVYEKRYASLWAEEGMYLIIGGSLEEYAETIEAEILETVGEAEEYSDMSGDIPVVSSSITTENFNVHIFAVATSHSILKLSASQKAGRNVQAIDLVAVDRALRQKVHKVAVFGDKKRGSEGFFNNSKVPTTASSYNPNTATWQDHLDFYADTMAAIADRNELTESTAWILLPNKLRSKLGTTYQNGDSGKSVLEAIMENFGTSGGGTLKGIVRLNESRADILERFGVHPVGTNKDRIVFVPENEDVVERLGDSPQYMPPQLVDMNYKTVFFHRTSETMVHYPDAMEYVDVARVN
jgi:hypothetical protein